MAAGENSKPVSRAIRAVASVKWGAKAKEVAASLKAQHAAGRDGDDSPAEPVWPTPKEQLEALKKVFRSSSRTSATTDADEAADEPPNEESLDRDAEHVAQALRGVDWGQVRAATSERSTEVARTMRSLADHVDWAKVQPVAAQVSSALIAAVAAGRIPVGGPLGSMVARAITDQNNLGNRVAANLQRTSAGAPPDFRPTIHRAIEATARET
ncbi:MAG TPA: hypothetical protein VNB52_13400 [Ilumatobacteraceae bacterium]|nr:hypothetical protein [Ilumatobacteraceae bacterium]